jgi:uncharacterized protein YecE (DUF72 family)
VEINSSFHRPHRQTTYARWGAAVPGDFRFSVKAPKAITHGQRLANAEELLEEFLDQVSGLGEKLGCVLVQLPPSLGLELPTAESFLAFLRDRYEGAAAIEPRHESWVTDEASELLVRFRIARVAADPVRMTGGGEPGGWPQLVYYRLHGSPRVYYSAYDEAYLHELSVRLERAARDTSDVWCIFDNTVLGAATANALTILDQLAS